MRKNGKGTDLKGKTISGGIIGGYLCSVCNVDGMTKNEADKHSQTIRHKEKQSFFDRQIREDKQNEVRDKKLLSYLQTIDPL